MLHLDLNFIIKILLIKKLTLIKLKKKPGLTGPQVVLLVMSIEQLDGKVLIVKLLI